MSTVKATHFEHPSASTAGITLAADGSVVLPQGFTGGLGSNVVQAVVTTIFTTTSTSYVDVTGATVSITPSGNTSKILVVATSVLNSSYGANTPAARLNISKSGTQLVEFGPARVADGIEIYGYSALFLDSPATTSPVSYEIRVRATNGTARVNGNGFGTYGATTLTAIEVAA